MRVLNAWIYDKDLARAGSILTKPLVGSTISHEWAEIKTNQGWYIAMFDDRQVLSLQKMTSQLSVTKCGLAVANNSDGDVNVTYFAIFKNNNVTMQDVTQYMSSYNGSYDLISNNCQDFARGLFRHLTKK